MAGLIFISGGTGFLGTELCARLLDTCDFPIYALIRAANKADALHRLREAWQHDAALYASVGRRVFPVMGDFTKPGLGLDAQTGSLLRRSVTRVFHVGAEVGFQKGEAELMSMNREGTRNMLAFAAALEELERFVYVSTAYVAGRRSGVIREDEAVGTAFSSLYEKSKAEAEGLVRASGLPFVICRQGMIVGDSRTGWARNFNTVYYILKRLLLGRLRVLPVRRDQGLNVVPVDYVAGDVAKLGFSDAAVGRAFHLICPTSMQPRVGELTEYIRAWAEKHLSVRLPKPAFLPLGIVRRAGLIHNGKPEEKRRTPLSNLLTLLPYFFSDQDFDRMNTDALCGPYERDWRVFIDALLSFACRANFMRQTGQTVFEQAMVRRAGVRYPIHYFNVRSDGVRRVSGQEVNEKVTAIAQALRRR
ncbi:MAG: SDR family oxidoreductase, partial [Oscillospiraceae bacterium]|nr:SDR family oxidoreductase [Oscillospiraceae bacterium]